MEIPEITEIFIDTNKLYKFKMPSGEYGVLIFDADTLNLKIGVCSRTLDAVASLKVPFGAIKAMTDD